MYPAIESKKLEAVMLIFEHIRDLGATQPLSSPWTNQLVVVFKKPHGEWHSCVQYDQAYPVFKHSPARFNIRFTRNGFLNHMMNQGVDTILNTLSDLYTSGKSFINFDISRACCTYIDDFVCAADAVPDQDL